MVSITASKPTLITDYYSWNKPRSMEPICWDDEDGEGWFVEQTSLYQDYRYEIPGRKDGIKSPLGGGRVNQQEGMVEDKEQVDSSGAEDDIWGSQDIVEEWLDRTQYLWDRQTLEEGAWVKVVDKTAKTGAGAGARSLTTQIVEATEAEDVGARAQSLTTLIVETPMTEDGGA